MPFFLVWLWRENREKRKKTRGIHIKSFLPTGAKKTAENEKIRFKMTNLSFHTLPVVFFLGVSALPKPCSRRTRCLKVVVAEAPLTEEATTDVFDAASKALFPFEFPYGFGSCGVPSDLSSPVESILGSSEIKSSDEEEHMAELTRRIVHELDLNHNFPSQKSKGMFMSDSPQSTWDLLHAVAGDMERMKLSNNEGYNFGHHHKGVLVPPRKPYPNQSWRRILHPESEMIDFLCCS